ncbi:MAG: helix-hairpin-helix domain-containing protein [Candidatus Micrarchaeota archaeon]|nr:helix-hairpin-helix domain-containing protein [Candidatus Micrarchaeota archaeon]
MGEQKGLSDFGGGVAKNRVEIYADARETSEVVSELEALGAVVNVKTLEVGDFILSDRVVAERKTRGDFESSIIDGRLFNQAKNMGENFESSVFVVEGERFEERVDRRALLGAVAALLTDYGASVFFTRDAEGTAEMLFAIAKREQLGEKRELRLLGERKRMDLAGQQQLLIECLPGVGPTMAKRLLEKFYTVENVITAHEAELLEVEGMGKAKAKAIKKVLTSAYKK